MRRLRAYLQAARVHHYVKNGFVWLPVIFGHKLLDATACYRSFCAFAAFCLVASAIYVMNDLRDRLEDRHHPQKRLRPIASGDISITEARMFAFWLLLSGGVLAGITLPAPFLAILGGYVLLNLAYSFRLKSMAIMDILCIAIGFVLRIFGGGIAADVSISHWLVVMTFLMALFLGLTKRRDDLVTRAASDTWNRTSLEGYNLEFISLGITVLSSVIVVAYILYTVSPEIVQIHHSRNLYLSGGWVIVGILRYLQRIFVYRETGSPVTLLFSDRILQLILAGWLIHSILMLYGRSLVW